MRVASKLLVSFTASSLLSFFLALFLFTQGSLYSFDSWLFFAAAFIATSSAVFLFLSFKVHIEPFNKLLVRLDSVASDSSDAGVGSELLERADEIGAAARSLDRVSKNLKLAVNLSAPELERKRGFLENALKVQEQVEGRLKESEAKFKALTDVAPNGVLLVDENGVVSFANPRLVQLLSAESDSAVRGRKFFDFVSEGSFSSCGEQFKTLLEGDSNTCSMEVELRTFNGRNLWTLVHGSRFLFKGKMVASIVVQDITQSRAREGELKRSNSLLEATLESTADGILAVDRNGGITRFNKRFAEMWRIPQEILDTHEDSKALDFVLNQLSNPQEFLSKVRELYSKPEAESFDVLKFKDGRTFERYSRPQRLGLQVVGRVWSFRDVTSGQAAEQELLKTNSLLESVLKTVPEIVMLLDREAVIRYTNRVVPGLAVKSVLGRSAYDYLPADQKNVFRESFEAVLRSGREKSFEVKGVGPKGAIVSYESTLTPVRENNEVGQILLVTRQVG